MTGADDERLVILDWRVLLASLVHFGRSHDGAVEHDLAAAITEIEQQRDRCRDAKATEVQRRKSAEAEIARLRAPAGGDLAAGGRTGMSEPRFTPAPWVLDSRFPYRIYSDDETGSIIAGCDFQFARPHDETAANARLIAAAPELHEAARLLDEAEDTHANCQECEGERVPELCPVCFPLFDDARIKRRAALAKAEGRS